MSQGGNRCPITKRFQDCDICVLEYCKDRLEVVNR